MVTAVGCVVAGTSVGGLEMDGGELEIRLTTRPNRCLNLAIKEDLDLVVVSDEGEIYVK